MRNGGYSIIDLSVTDNLYTNAVKAVNTEKPILVYGDDVPYFADSVTADSDAVTITKGGQIILISNANAITKTGDKDGALLSSIVDDNGDARFVEGAITNDEISGVTYNYSKWSLSGTHLMLVIAFSVTSGTVLSSKVIGRLKDVVPQYILDKIVPLSGTRVDFKSFSGYTSDLNNTQSISINFTKSGSDVNLNCGSFTASYDLNFRIQFDLLIDAE